MCTHTYVGTHASPKGAFPPFQGHLLLLVPKALSFETVSHLWSVTSVGSLGLGNKPGSFGELLPACQEADRKPAEFLSTPASPAGRVAQTTKFSLAKSQVLGYRGWVKTVTPRCLGECGGQDRYSTRLFL